MLCDICYFSSTRYSKPLRYFRMKNNKSFILISLCQTVKTVFLWRFLRCGRKWKYFPCYVLQNCSLWFFVLVISSYAKFYVVTFCPVTFCPICFVKMQNLNCDFSSCDFSSVTFWLWLFVLWLSVLHSSKNTTMSLTLKPIRKVQFNTYRTDIKHSCQ